MNLPQYGMTDQNAQGHAGAEAAQGGLGYGPGASAGGPGGGVAGPRAQAGVGHPMAGVAPTGHGYAGAAMGEAVAPPPPMATGPAASPGAYPYGAPGFAPYPQGMPVGQHPYYGAPTYAPYAGPGPYYPPAGMHGAYAAMAYPGVAAQPTARLHAGQGPQGGMSGLVEEIANGGSGLSSLGKLLNLDDSEFWKGALIGAAAVLLLTNESVQGMLFKTGIRATEAMQSGVEKVKETVSEVAGKAKE